MLTRFKQLEGTRAGRENGVMLHSLYPAACVQLSFYLTERSSVVLMRAGRYRNRCRFYAPSASLALATSENLPQIIGV